jgi:diaminobutyrate-2-oxoglutarate transaminase
MNVFARLESEVRSYCRHFPAVFERALGSFLYDRDGREYIDFLSCAGAVNYGHNDPVIKGAVIRYLEANGVVTSLDLHTAAKADFIEKFERIVLQPRALTYKLQFTGPTGTSVVESAIKLARKCTDRSNIVAFTNAFHGMTAGSLSLTGNRSMRRHVLGGAVSRLPYCGYFEPTFDSIDYFRTLLADSSSGLDLPAAVIVETVQAEGGVNLATSNWLRALRALTQSYNILLIIDDIQTGCGRTGPFFSFTGAGIEPDMICLSKSLSGLGLPFSLLLFKEDLDRWSPGEDSGTFRGNNLAFAAAAAALSEYWTSPHLENHVARLEGVLEDWTARLAARRNPEIRACRGRGLIFGIEWAHPAHAREIAACCFRNGLIIETCGSESQVLKILPPLTISEETLRAGLQILEDSIATTITSSALRPDVRAAVHA